MMQSYKNVKFSKQSISIIDNANSIIDEYQAQGFQLTLRQLYYQFVSRDLIPNKQSEYKRLGSIINDGRLAGLIDWDAIEDRTRNLRSLSHWTSPASIIQACGEQFNIDKWANQPCHLEVWIEKDALVGVIEGVCEKFDVPYFSCRGYTSQSEMHKAAERLIEHEDNGQQTAIIYLGDHDPSGIDMTRDIEDRIAMFGSGVEVVRIALTMEQVEEQGPPPNPAKTTDSRYTGYINKYGDESWELDALEPKYIAQIIEDEIGKYLDREIFEASLRAEKAHRANLKKVAFNWEKLVKKL